MVCGWGVSTNPPQPAGLPIEGRESKTRGPIDTYIGIEQCDLSRSNYVCGGTCNKDYLENCSNDLDEILHVYLDNNSKILGQKKFEKKSARF